MLLYKYIKYLCAELYSNIKRKRFINILKIKILFRSNFKNNVILFFH